MSDDGYPRRSRSRTSGDARHVHAIRFTFLKASTERLVAAPKRPRLGAG